MSTHTAESLVRGLTARRGATTLLRRLGFGALGRARRLGDWSVATAAADHRCAHVVELTGPLTDPVLRDVARAVHALDDLAFHVCLIAASDYARVALTCAGPDRQLRWAMLEPARARPADIELISELLPPTGETGSAAALRLLRALDRTRVTQRFFRDLAGVRDMIAGAWTGTGRGGRDDRDALALLLLSRLLFLYFLQRRGQLAGDADYLPNLLRAWQQRPAPGRSFYRARLRTLFFGVLNRRPGKRTPSAQALGALPYLNGGLFEEHTIELRHPDLDLPDSAAAHAFTALLERYRFTSTEPAEAAGESPTIDPEMLGRIFEGLMHGERRGRTGTFYTPPAIVDRLVGDALAEHITARTGIRPADAYALLDGAAAPAHVQRSLSSVRVLDPACGSGAFLMGALVRLARLRRGEDTTKVRRDVVAHALHGVDLLEDAALICSLRLWLALIPHHGDEPVAPLPNLDRRIRQGDALVDPLDLRAAAAGHPLDVVQTPAMRAAVRRLAPAAVQYVHAGPEQKPRLRRELGAIERELAHTWTTTLADRLDRLERELRARSLDRDLFGEPTPHADAAARRIGAVRKTRAELDRFAADLDGTRALPFFSFRVHFAEAADGFDLILSNPPWVRSHRWPPAVRRLLRERYRVCTDAGWPEAARLCRQPSGAGAQVDLSLLFLERCTELLAPHGTLGMLLPAKLLRSLYAGGARRLIGERLVPVSIEDHSLDHRGVFDADAFTSVLIAHRAPAAPAAPAGDAAAAPIRVTITRAGAEPLRFLTSLDRLPLVPGDDRSPWLLAPPACIDAFRRMQRQPPIGREPSLSVRRGVMTGCNDVLVLRTVAPRIGDLAHVHAEGHGRGERTGYTAHIEASAIRPALRGTDVAAWRIDVRRHLVWVPANDDPAAPTPPRTQRYLSRHRARLLEALHGRTARPGTLQRLGRHTLGAKVVWSDLASDLRACAVPPTVRAVTGTELPVVPLNTVYFLATRSHRDSLLLAAYLNATPVRTFARAIAERAKDAHFRFFAWTLSVVPLPADWRTGPRAERLLELSTAAHEARALCDVDRAEIDALVAAAYGLTTADCAAIRSLSRWFAGNDGGTP